MSDQRRLMSCLSKLTLGANDILVIKVEHASQLPWDRLRPVIDRWMEKFPGWSGITVRLEAGQTLETVSEDAVLKLAGTIVDRRIAEQRERDALVKARGESPSVAGPAAEAIVNDDPFSELADPAPPPSGVLSVPTRRFA